MMAEAMKQVFYLAESARIEPAEGEPSQLKTADVCGFCPRHAAQSA